MNEMKEVTNKLNVKFLLGLAATMAIVVIMYKLFVKQYVTSTGDIKTKFTYPGQKEDR